MNTFKFLPISNSFHASYCVRKAEAIVAANRLIRCGVKPRQHDEIVVEGMCLQSNSTNYPPRTITGVLRKKDFGRLKVVCASTAGAC